MEETLLRAFVMLFVVIDPIGQIPTFIALTHGAPADFRKRMAIRGVLIAAAILFPFAFVGSWLLGLLGIGLPAMKIAGGILLFMIAVDMILALESGIRSTTGPELEEAEQRQDISVFPLGIPLIAGPGAFASITLLLGRHDGDWFITGAILGSLAVVLVITLISLLSASILMRFLGRTGANVISRVLGILLAALAVQFVLDGLHESSVLG